MAAQHQCFNGKNGTNAGINSDFYADNTLLDGDVISCMLTSNASCLTRSTAVSNTIVMRVQKAHKPVNLGADVSICDGKSITLDAGNSYSTYSWQNGSGASTFTTANAGIYSIRVQEACGFSSDTVVVSLYPKPAAFLPLDTTICKNESVRLQPVDNYKDYLWNTGSVSSTFEVKSLGLYWLQVTDQNDCLGRDSIIITIKECNNKLYVPSSFTPNGDGRNDYFKPFFNGHINNFKFSIYNRWGQMLFMSTDLNKMWDGKEMGRAHPTGVFVWTCTYQFNGEEKKLKKAQLH